MITLLILIILAAFVIITSLFLGVGFLLTFGDLIVAICIIVLIAKIIIGRNKR